jgi:TonB family protein
MNCILRPFGLAFFLAAIVFLWCVFPAGVCAQENSSTPTPVTADIKLNYPNNPGGLEKLAKDILKAQKESDTVTAGRLLESLVLPHARSWYAENFGEAIAANEGVEYEKSTKGLPVALGATFLNLYQKNSTKPTAVRLGHVCDLNTSEEIFNVLQARITQVPLYELRFINGDKFFSISLFAFVDGGFRFILRPKPRRPQQVTAAATADKPAIPFTSRVRQGGNVAAAKLIHKVQPQYPEEARHQLLQGTVRFHAIIAKDGTIAQLRLEAGVCSLAEAAYDAVRQWRYAPTSINGDPVEVDTTIDVIFSLER